MRDRILGLELGAGDYLPKPFYRMDKSRSKETGGVNLGATDINSLTIDDVEKREKDSQSIKYISPLINAPCQEGIGIKSD